MFNRLGILHFAFPGGARAQIRAMLSLRWSAAARRDPDLVTDLIALGGVFNQAALMDGLPDTDTDPQRLAYQAGRRDLALELIALAGCTTEQINKMLMEASDED